jgi:Heparinase II/III-like protein/Heparinase II/III N-terminus
MLPTPWNAFKALVQLGIRPVMLNALYRIGLATGHYRRLESRDQLLEAEVGKKLDGLRPVFVIPSSQELLEVLGDSGKVALLAEADEIMSGRVRLFGSEPVNLNLSVPGKLEHWTAYETGKADLRDLTLDLKMLWEPARFGWAFCLGRAFHLTGDEKYAETFWCNFEIFTAANPPCLGPNWTSGQEVALRLMAFTWAAQVFSNSSASTPERNAALARSVDLHALRIVPTFVYARSQQNNHLLTEAAGLLTAGLALPDHPEAPHWRFQGWKWLTAGLHSQIDSYGEYDQHSTNYHRLMLQVVLWTNALLLSNARSNDFAEYPGGVSRYWPRKTHDALVRSIHWLLSILDSDSGHTPNLGANDGAYIFPLTVCPFSDYRPVLNAAARAFLDYDLPRGSWDEMALWFSIPLENRTYVQLPRYLGDQLYGKDSWAYLRTAQFSSRPSHADQLHVDLWWHGLNVAQDAGTYLYNADPPWDNRLTTALVHNTVTVNHRDQFTRAGRFLYLDWFNAYRRSKLEGDPLILQRIRGRHWGYWRQGVRHDRTVTAYADGHWQVRDDLLPLRMPWDKRPLTYRLHWLLPDWQWQAELRESTFEIRLKSPLGWVLLSLSTGPHMEDTNITLVRAGETVYGSGQAEPVRGWSSPTYALKVPALSLAMETKSPNDVQFNSEFNFPI